MWAVCIYVWSVAKKLLHMAPSDLGDGLSTELWSMLNITWLFQNLGWIRISQQLRNSCISKNDRGCAWWVQRFYKRKSEFIYTNERTKPIRSCLKSKPKQFGLPLQRNQRVVAQFLLLICLHSANQSISHTWEEDRHSCVFVGGSDFWAGGVNEV